jgi:hypothetical protein
MSGARVSSARTCAAASRLRRFVFQETILICLITDPVPCWRSLQRRRVTTVCHRSRAKACVRKDGFSSPGLPGTVSLGNAWGTRDSDSRRAWYEPTKRPEATPRALRMLLRGQHQVFIGRRGLKNRMSRCSRFPTARPQTLKSGAAQTETRTRPSDPTIPFEPSRATSLPGTSAQGY